MYITGLGTAVPPQRHAQRDGWDAVQQWPKFSQLQPRSRAILKKVLCGDNGIDARHLALESLAEVFDSTPDDLQARFTTHAPALASEAGRRALKDAGCLPAEIDAVLISTCTGYLCPGLTSYVSEQLGLRPDVFALDLVGQGCGAALPNLRAGEAILAAGRANKILSICVEVCSAAFFWMTIRVCSSVPVCSPMVQVPPSCPQNPSPDAVASGGNSPAHAWSPPSAKPSGSATGTASCATSCGRRFPGWPATSPEKLFSESLVAAGVKREQITGWILHTGGRDVILALRDKLKLSADDVRHSTAVLREFGNISSPTVYFVLERALNDSVPDGLWWMSAFGAGFSCHGAFLEVSPA